MQRWKAAIPALVSVALIVWLVSRVNPDALRDAAAELNWPALTAATALMVLGLYLWDAVCLRTLFAADGATPSYREVLHVRGTSYLVGVVNYELGQGAVALGMARLQQDSVVSALSRIVLLAYYDLLVLLGFGLLGSSLDHGSRTDGVRLFSGIGFCALLAFPLVGLLLPASLWERLAGTRWLLWLKAWRLKRSFYVLILRVVYYAILIGYGAVALRICQVHVDRMLVLSTIPMVLLADALPSASGLGTRDAALQLLLQPEQREVLLALSIFWSTGLIFGRSGIGMAHMWVPRLLGLASISSSADEGRDEGRVADVASRGKAGIDHRDRAGLDNNSAHHWHG